MKAEYMPFIGAIRENACTKVVMIKFKFEFQDVIFGLDAGIVFYGRRAKDVDRPNMLNISAFGDKVRFQYVDRKGGN